MEEPVVEGEEPGQKEAREASPAIGAGRDPEQANEREEADHDRLEPVDREDRAEGPVLDEGQRDRDGVREQEGEQGKVGPLHDRGIDGHALSLDGRCVHIPSLTNHGPDDGGGAVGGVARARGGEVEDRLGTGPGGLAVAEVAARREAYGPNRLPTRPPPSPLTLFLRQFKSPLIYVLLAAAGVSAALGDLRDAAFILVVVLVNAVVGTFQEWKAESAAEALRHLLETEVRVLRDGRDLSVSAEDLVPGDRVLLESGNRVPADLRLVEVDDLAVDESALTGESLPVEKSTQPVGGRRAGRRAALHGPCGHGRDLRPGRGRRGRDRGPDRVRRDCGGGLARRGDQAAPD